MEAQRNQKRLRRKRLHMNVLKEKKTINIDIIYAYKTNRKMADVSIIFSVITLNINVLNSPIKNRVWQDGFLKKHDSTIFCLQETHFLVKDTYRLKVT